MRSSPSQNPEEPSGLLETLVAAFSGVLLGLFLSKASAPIQESKNSRRPTTQTDDTSQNAEAGFPLTAIVPPTPETSEFSCKPWHHKTPWWKIILDVGMLLATAGAFGAAGYYAHISKKMWVEMQEQSRIQRNASINAERPWIKLIDVTTRGNNPLVPALSFQHPQTWPKDRQQVTFQIDVSYRNVGRSVARVTVDFWLFLELWKNGYDDAIRKDGKEFCDSHTKVDRNLSVIAYPSDEPSHWDGAGANLVKEDNTNYFTDINPGIGIIVPSVAVCINYQFGDSPEVYQTRAFYEIFRKDNRSRFFEVGRERPERDIFLVRYPYLDAAY
jgi:hypothetical protein